MEFLLGEEFTSPDRSIGQLATVVERHFYFDGIEAALSTDQFLTNEINVFVVCLAVLNTQIVLQVQASADFLAAAIAPHVNPEGGGSRSANRSEEL